MTSHRLKILTIVACFIAILAIGVGRFAWNRRDGRLDIPDEKKAGVALLASKLTGPGYFTESASVLEEGGPWITPNDARAQISRIVGERKFDQTHADQLSRLIDRLIEQPPSRIVGSDRINLVRLNLALDQIRE